MSHYSVTKEFHFSAAHRLEGHPKCGRLHGHNYKVVVCVSSEELEASGMVIDFGELKAIVSPLIDMFDHKYLSSRNNTAHDDELSERNDVIYLPCRVSTAESIAKYIADVIVKSLPENIRVWWVEVQETPTSTARYYP